MTKRRTDEPQLSVLSVAARHELEVAVAVSIGASKLIDDKAGCT